MQSSILMPSSVRMQSIILMQSNILMKSSILTAGTVRTISTDVRLPVRSRKKLRDTSYTDGNRISTFRNFFYIDTISAASLAGNQPAGRKLSAVGSTYES